MKFWLIIPAAGIGARMQADRPKQYLEAGGKTILAHTLACFLDHPGLQAVVVVLAEDDGWWPALEQAQHPQVYRARGGQERADSVLSGLHRLCELGAAGDDWVLVHDAARPLLTRADLDGLLEQLWQDPCGGLLAVPASDTLKQGGQENRVVATVPRQQIWHALTPQMFRLKVLISALERALAAGAEITDEASAMEQAGYAPRLVAGSRLNFKITTPDDLRLFELLLR